MKNNKLFIGFLAFLSLIACSENQDEIKQETKDVSMHIVVNEGNLQTKGFSKDEGVFDENYPLSSLFIHARGTDNFVEVPIEDGKIILSNIIDGTKPTIININGVDFPRTGIYFTSQKDKKYSINSLGSYDGTKNPVYGLKSAGEDGENLFRSVVDYTHNDVMLMGNVVKLYRLNAALKVDLLFASADAPIENNSVITSADDWLKIMGDSYSDWEIKLYLGTCFPGTFNLETKESLELGWINNTGNQFVAFQPSSTFVYGGGSTPTSYSGFGITSEYLFTPICPSNDGIKATLVVKHGGVSKYTDFKPFSTSAFNNSYYIGLVLSAESLKDAFASSAANLLSTKSSGGMEKMDVQVIQMITEDPTFNRK